MPQLPDGPALDRLKDALKAEAGAHEALLAGDEGTAAAAFAEAVTAYRASWELAGPEAYGRLVGLLKAAIIAGDPHVQAAYVLDQLPAEATSPTASYARALAALVTGDDATARDAAPHLRAATPAFANAADAIEALADRDAARYAEALRRIVDDFEGREDHLTGVPIADTALMLERLAEPRGLQAAPDSKLLP